MLTLYVLRGLPGSGKTTLAQVLGQALGISYFEADQFFEEHGSGFDRKLLGAAHEQCRRRVIGELEAGRSVIVSNTTTSEDEACRWAYLSEEYSARLVSLVVENRHRGGSIHGVPAPTLAAMRERFALVL